jgi:hypothetical protein
MGDDVLEVLRVILRGDDAQLKRVLRDIERETADTKQKVSRNLNFADIGAGLAGIGGGGGIIYALRSMAQESVNTEAALRSFNNTLARNGLNQNDASASIARIANQFGLLETQVQEAATPLLKMGLDLDTVERTLSGLAASAGLAGANIGDAMITGARGVAMNRSELLETAGIMVNASQSWGGYAAEIGKATSELSDNEKALAYALAVIREAAPDVEDFTDAYGDFAQAQAAATREAVEFRNNVGSIAQDIFTPLTSSVAGAIGFVNDLPEPLQRVAVGMVAAGGGAAALAGSLALLTPVLGVLSGPAGLFLLAAAGIGALAGALAGAASEGDPFIGKQQQIADAADTAATAIGSAGSREGLIGALDAFAQALGEDATRALEGYRGELSNTGDSLDTLKGKAFEAAKEMRLAQLEADRASLAASLSRTGQRAQNNTQALVGDAEDRLTRQAGFEVKIRLEQDPETKQLQAKLANKDIVIPADNLDLTFAIARELENINANINDDETLRRLDALDAEIARVQASQAAPPTPNEPAPPPSTTRSPRTVADVFNDLAKEGQIAEQRAAAIGTVEAAVESLETRARAVDSALTEALELGASAEQVDYLVGRLDALNQELLALGEVPLSVDVEAQVARNIVPEVEAQVAELESIPTPEIGVQMTGDPVDIFGVVFDPTTGETTVGAAPTVRIKALVDIEMPNASARVTPERPILGIGGDASTGPIYYGPRPYAQVGGSVPLMTSPDYTGDMPTVELDEFAIAAEEFKGLVVDAGLDFAGNIANALADGRITGDEAAGIGGGLFGGLAMAGVSLIPGGAAFAPLAGMVGNLLGGWLGGLFGGESEGDRRSRAASEMERRGGASTVNFNIFASQINNYDGAPNDPSVAAQFDRNLRRHVAEILQQADLSKIQKNAGATT